MNPFFGSVVLLPFEQLLNGLLQQDPHCLEKLAEHAGKVLEVESTLPPTTVTIVIHSGGLKLMAGSAADTEQQANARVSAKLSDLSQLLFSADNNRPMANPKVSISGDAEFVQDVYRLAGDLEIDWEGQLANIVGDVATQQFSQFFNQAFNWSKQSFDSASGVVDEYLHEEIRAVPAAAEVEQFAEQLDDLKLSIDRLSARKDKLQTRIDALSAARSEPN